MALIVEYQVALRRLYDMGINKAQAAKRLGISEPTVYRYYAKWSALKIRNDHPYTVDVSDLLSAKLIEELNVQATMRRMSIQGFVSAIIATVLQDGLSKAILDITETNPVKKRLTNGTE